MQCLSCLSARGYHLTVVFNASFSLEPSIAQPESQSPIGRDPALPWTNVIIRGDGSDERRRTKDGVRLNFRGTIDCLKSNGLLRASLGSSAPRAI